MGVTPAPPARHGVGIVDALAPQCICGMDFAHAGGGWAAFNDHLAAALDDAERAGAGRLRAALDAERKAWWQHVGAWEDEEVGSVIDRLAAALDAEPGQPT